MDQNKREALKEMFPEEIERIEKGCCPLCGISMVVATPFRNEVSRKEFEISGMCQSCQDEIFEDIPAPEEVDYEIIEDPEADETNICLLSDCRMNKDGVCNLTDCRLRKGGVDQ